MGRAEEISPYATWNGTNSVDIWRGSYQLGFQVLAVARQVAQAMLQRLRAVEDANGV
jgi:hypothetical protein